MKDMLVRLMDLPDITLEVKHLYETDDVVVRKPIAAEKSLVLEWVGKNFSINWKDEVDVAFSSVPVNCFIAQRNQDILGFACFECSAKNFFGPTGVIPSERGKDVGKILLIKALKALKEMGYAYAIIGGVGPIDYYEKVVKAKVIEGSEKSIYENLLKHKK
ncbi:MAG: GNAT family N-acetyltransferase [Bacteroidota bacterium]